MHVRDKLPIAGLPYTMWSIFSSSLMFCCYFTHLKAARYEKLRKYWSYCTRNRAITDAYKKLLDNKKTFSARNITPKFQLNGFNMIYEVTVSYQLNCRNDWFCFTVVFLELTKTQRSVRVMKVYRSRPWHLFYLTCVFLLSLAGLLVIFFYSILTIYLIWKLSIYFKSLL